MDISNFPANQLLIAFSAAIFTQIVISIVSWIRIRIDLTTKKKLLSTDLKKQKEIILKLQIHYKDLYKKFENRELKEYQSDAFQNLHTEIYQSISKPDLYKIYKNNITEIVEIYKAIEFLTKSLPEKRYSEYTQKLKLHREDKKNEATHNDYCRTHLNLIEISKKQIELNISTTNDLIIDIEKGLTF